MERSHLGRRHGKAVREEGSGKPPGKNSEGGQCVRRQGKRAGGKPPEKKAWESFLGKRQGEPIWPGKKVGGSHLERNHLGRRKGKSLGKKAGEFIWADGREAILEAGRGSHLGRRPGEASWKESRVTCYVICTWGSRQTEAAVGK